MVRALRKTVWIACLGLAMSLPGTAVAQSRPGTVQQTKAPASGKVSIDLMVVYANYDDYVDPKLKEVMQNLRHTRFTGFTLLSEESERLAPGSDTSFTVAGGRKLKVSLVSKDQRQAKVRIRMFKDGNKVLDTTVSIPRGRYFMIAGPKYKAGNLILPVGVEY